MSLQNCEKLADTLIRFPIFLTTTHYWEGRWLLDMADIPDLAQEKRKTGRKTVVPRWQRRMKLTPCAVSTFYNLPSLMRVRQYQDSGYVDDYLFNTIDLLIVDEAGQVSPEIGGAAFALAKRALVIGDTAQLKPIWNIVGAVDTGNLHQNALIESAQTAASPSPFVQSGRAASSGSIMRVGEHVSRYHQDDRLPRGLNLYDHWRCFDEIIGYSNHLCYHGTLNPKRMSKAKASVTDGLPAMGYLQIDGMAEKPRGKSRHNLTEAETIARWLAENRAALEHSYPDQGLAQIIGIVSPFAAQTAALRKALSNKGIDVSHDNGVMVGTVHSFQGGQRPVIIFSPTYSRHADGGFIDHDSAMLNVAVSRAMNSFLTFGDLNCFSAAPPSSPRGLLAQHLFMRSENEIIFAPSLRQDLVPQENYETLTYAEQHDEFLHKVLRQCQREVHIITPWITLRALQTSGLLEALASAFARGIALTIYTDPKLNYARSGADSYIQAANMLKNTGAKVIELRDIHSKIVTADDNLYCAGSFNWLSAARGGTYARHETSLVYRGHSIATEIDNVLTHLKSRAV